MQRVRELLAAHERLKKRIHAFRIPLSKNGQRFMGLVYFSIPLVVGKLVYDKVIEVQERNWRVDPVTGKMVVPDAVRKREQETLDHANKARASVEYLLEHRHDPLPGSPPPSPTPDVAAEPPTAAAPRRSP